MKRLLTAILSVCLLCASAAGAGGVRFARAETAAGGEAGQAPKPLKTQSEDALTLPSSYEQYLPLASPSDVAVTENYTAIADGSSIYIYNRREGEYARYEHIPLPGETDKNKVAKLQFSETGLLYFLDASTFLYELDPAALYGGDAASQKAEKTQLVCSTFTIFSDVVYFTNVSSDTSQISKITLDTPDSTQATLVQGGIQSKPAIAQDNGVLYYTDAGKYLYRVKESEDGYKSSFVAALTESETVVSLAVYSGILYYTDTAKNLYLYDLTASRNLASFGGGYSALSVYDGYVYAVKGDAVKQYSPAAGGFTDYEICGGSDASNRLSGATETILSENLLITADNGNGRVSVYDAEKEHYRTFPIESEAALLASDGETLLAANASSAVLYDLESGDKLTSFHGFNSNLVGIAGVYGNYYFVTDNNYFYRTQKSSAGEWTLESTPKPSGSHTARLLTQDVYGDLYVAYSDGGVYRFTETAFMDAAAAGTKTCTIPVLSEKISVDYEQTVYALYQNELYKCADEQTKYALGKSLVYGQTESTRVLSFAFGVEESAVYLLYAGDFAVRTYAIPLPTVKAIAVGGADEEIFSNQSAEFSLVRTQENALMVNFDIAALSGAEVFPYLSFARNAESRIALRLGETETYNLIAVFDEATKSYATALVLKRYCEEIPREEYLKPAEGFTEAKGYLTNAVTLYKYPYLTGLLTVSPLKKNAQVTVLGEIDTLDYRYYYVSYTDEEGAERTGYVPKAYVTNFNGAPPQTRPLQYGAGETDLDSLWRMAFLLLGCASICVLVDYMILHKKKP